MLNFIKIYIVETQFQTHKWTNAKSLVYVHESIAILATLMVYGLFNKVLTCICNTFIL
jgi:hypothetical protein